MRVMETGTETACTQHVAKYMWTAWAPDGKPDLSPLALDLTILPSIKVACVRATSDILENSKNLPPELQADPDTLANPLHFIYELAYEELNQTAFKLLKKVFVTVQKNYYTVTLQDPSGTFPDYVGYVPDYAFSDIEYLVRTRGLATGEQATAMARTASLKKNACRKLESKYICGQPVSCQTMCKFWIQPDEGYPGQCYYQLRNKEQKAKDLSDSFLCGNEEAIAELTAGQ